MIHHASRMLSVIIKQWQLLIRTKNSVIYQLVSSGTFYTNYHRVLWYGRIQSVHREIQEAFIKHLRVAIATTQTTRSMHSYRDMVVQEHGHIIIPFIFAHIPVKKQMRLALEPREIQLYPKHLNKEQRYRRKW